MLSEMHGKTYLPAINNVSTTGTYPVKDTILLLFQIITRNS